MANTVVGIFDNPAYAQQAIGDLMDNGYVRENIDISSSDKEGGYDEKNKDSISKFFDSLFGDNEESYKHAQLAERGTVVTVHTKNREDAVLAADILDKNGALSSEDNRSSYKESSSTESGSGDFISIKDVDKDNSYAGTGTDNTRTGNEYENYSREGIESEDYTESGSSKSIPVIEEQMNVGKREVDSGSVRVRSRIFDKPVEETLRLRYEDINVSREPVDRKATQEDMEHFKESSIEMSAKEEVPVVDKEARVVEEVRLKKEAGERTEKIRESVRRQDVDVDTRRKDREGAVDKDQRREDDDELI